jgi:hypothetical protein
MKAILFRFAAALISLVIVTLLGEVALRLFAPRLGVAVDEKNRFYRFDHDLGWAPLELRSSVRSARTEIAEGFRVIAK